VFNERMTNTPDCSRAGEADLGPLLLHINHAALLLGLSRYQTRNLINSGRLPGEKVGGRVYVPAQAVDEYVASIGAA